MRPPALNAPQIASVANGCASPSLGVLNLSFNRLTDLPAAIGSALPALQQLYVAENRLAALPDSLLACPLTDLFASGNPLKSLPAGLEKCTGLVKLSLAACQLAVLPDGVGRLPRLHFLDVSFNALTKLPATLSQLTCVRRRERPAVHLRAAG